MLREEALIDAGLTCNETKIYLSLLELGSTTVTNISEKTKLHRTNVYDAIRKLSDKGVVASIKQDNITFYEAQDPNVLISMLEEKQEKLKKIIPELQLLKKLAENSSDINIIKGITSFIDNLYELLNQKQEILVLGMPEKAIKLLGARIFPFHAERVKQRIKLKKIFSEDIKINISKKEYTETRTHVKEMDFGVSIIIAGNVVLITDWSNEISTLKIKNVAFAKTYQAQFDIVWQNSKFKKQ